MKLKYITFCLENCDRITIDGKYIGDFVVKDIKTEIRRIATNAIDRIDIADTFAIEIHKDANKERYPFGQIDKPNWKQMTFDRLVKYSDITSIEFELYDDYTDEMEEGAVYCTECYDYWVVWTGDDDETNDAQSNYVSKDGHLYIVISADKTIEDFFDKEDIDDSDYIDFHFDMCDVGDAYGDPNRYNKE
jgi:hypothetical protein